MKLNRRDFIKITLVWTGNILLSPKNNARAHAADSDTPTKAVLVDASRCVGCWGCYTACKRTHNLLEIDRRDPEDPPPLDDNTLTTLGTAKINNHQYYVKRQCMHCRQPACVEACIVGALKKTPDGPVIYDENKCIGCRYCMVACPFGVPDFEWEDPTPWIRKCDFCRERQEEGLEPVCVGVCPSGALKSGDRTELIKEARERIAAEPDKYIDHIYGEFEAGGTSWLYISPVPLEEFGFPELGPEAVTVNAARAMGAVPPVLLGVAAAMAGIYWFTRRRHKLIRIENGDNEEKRGSK